MAEAALELRTILEAAEQAASVEDFASAEQYLRQAAVLQEAQLSPAHPDLANTLNNLGIVCERLGKSADAEASYRRAYAIARAGLSPGDPLVLTSEQNLRDFCAATGKPFEVAAPVPAPPVVAPAPAPPATSAAPKTSAAPAAAAVPAAPAVPPKPATPAKPSAAAKPTAAAKPAAPARPAAPAKPAAPAGPAAPAARTSSPVATEHRSNFSIWLVIGAVILIVAVAWWFSTRDSAEPIATPTAPRVETAPPREEPASPAEAPPPVVASTPAAPETTSAPERPVAVAPAKPAVTETRSRPTTGATALSLVEAKLCRSLSTSDWRCTLASSPAAPGMFIFYTRVKSARDTTVQHRWLMNGKLLRTVNLRVGANPGAGYRTYSRNTVIAERRGNWTIELRDADGALLHEERVVVQ